MLIDLPFDVQMAEIEFDIDTYEPLPVYKPAATRKQIEKALDMLQAAEKGVPFMPLRGIIGSDILRHRPEWKVIRNPFSEAEDNIVLLPALVSVALGLVPLGAFGLVQVGRLDLAP